MAVAADGSASTSGTATLALGVAIGHLLLSPLVFSALTRESYELPKALLLATAVLGLAALGGARTLEASGAWRGLGGGLRRDPLVWGAGLWFFSCALSTAFGLGPAVAFTGREGSYAGLTTQIAYAALFVASRALAGSQAASRALLWAVAAGAAGSACYGLFQAAGLDPVGGPRGSDWRVSGPLGNPNFLGAYLACALPACLFLAYHAIHAGQRAAAGLLAGTSAAAGGAIWLTGSRAALLAVACSLPALAIGWWWAGQVRAARLLAAGFALAVLAAAALVIAGGPGSGMGTRLARLTQPDPDVRLDLWRAAGRMFTDHPVVGIGLEAFPIAYPRYRHPEVWERKWGQTASRAHCGPLHVAATQGTVGLGALGLMGAGCLLAGRRAGQRAATPEGRVLVASLGAGLLAFGVQDLFGFNVVAVGALVATYGGVLSRLAYGEPATGCPLGPVALGAVLAVGGALAVGLLAFNLLTATPAAERPGPVWLAAPLLAVLLAVAVVAYRVEGGVNAARPKAGRAGKRQRVAWVVAGVGLLVALEEAVITPFRAATLRQRGLTLAEAGRPEESLADAHAAAASLPYRPVYWTTVGVAHDAAALLIPTTEARRRHLTEAIDAHRRALALDPENPQLWGNVARSLAEAASAGMAVTRQEVLDAFREALARAPYNGLYLEQAAKAALQLGDREAGEALAQLCLSLYPNEAQARALLGIAAMQREEWPAAARDLTAATTGHWHGDRGAEAAAWANLAVVHLKLGHPAEALAAADQALVLFPNYDHPLRSRKLARDLLATRQEKGMETEVNVATEPAGIGGTTERPELPPTHETRTR